MAADTSDRARRSPERPDWKAEYAQLSALDRRTALEPADLERLGTAAYLAGHESDSIDANTRAHNLALERGDTRQAARSAFWVAFAFLGARELTRAAGWAARARRLLEESRHDCVECGYVLLPQALEQVAANDLAGAEATFTAAERLGERFADADLTSLARQGRGRVLIALGRQPEGVALFDEVMVAVTAGEVTPIVSGVVYCSVISACFELLDIRRAQEWTEALNDWCETQSGLVPYRGECLDPPCRDPPAARTLGRSARRGAARVRRAGIREARRTRDGGLRARRTAPAPRRNRGGRRGVPPGRRKRANASPGPGAAASRAGAERGGASGDRTRDGRTRSRAAARERAHGRRRDSAGARARRRRPGAPRTS